MPDLDECLDEIEDGFEVFVNGLKLSDNPHPENISEHHCWNIGWQEAEALSCQIG